MSVLLEPSGPDTAQNICLENQHIKINVVVTQAILDFCNMELFQGGELP